MKRRVGRWIAREHDAPECPFDGASIVTASPRPPRSQLSKFPLTVRWKDPGFFLTRRQAPSSYSSSSSHTERRRPTSVLDYPSQTSYTRITAIHILKNRTDVASHRVKQTFKSFYEQRKAKCALREVRKLFIFIIFVVKSKTLMKLMTKSVLYSQNRFLLFYFWQFRTSFTKSYFPKSCVDMTRWYNTILMMQMWRSIIQLFFANRNEFRSTLQ